MIEILGSLPILPIICALFNMILYYLICCYLKIDNYLILIHTYPILKYILSLISEIGEMNNYALK